MAPVSPDILSALNAGIQSEVASYVFYIEASKRSDTADFKDVLEKLAYEEKEHFHILERQYDSLVRSEMWISTADIMKQEGLPEIPEAMSNQHRDLMSQVAEAADIQAIFDIAYQLEVDAHELFAKAAETIASEEGKKMFLHLSKFEEGHMRLIDEMRKKYR